MCLSSKFKVKLKFFIPADKGQEFDRFQEIDVRKGWEISEALFLGFNFTKKQWNIFHNFYPSL